jgi:predicted outer membrane repeat protein
MWFSSWFAKRQHSTTSGRRRTSPRPRPSCRPRLEALEDRWLPSQIGLTVTSLADSGPGTLRAAILTADAGSHSDKFTIGFAVTGTIDLQSPLPDLNNTIAVQGPGANRLTVERAAGYSFSSAIVTVDAGQTASLSGLTVANGNAGGIVNDGTLTVSGCTISGNSVPNVVALSGGGGGILNYLGTLTVSGSTVSNNTARFGGGIYNVVGTLTVSGSTISGNSAAANGGGILDEGSSPTTISNSTISGNSAPPEGGGISFEGVGFTLSGTTVSGNTGGLGGGIFDNAIGSNTVSACTISGNTGALGGGIWTNANTIGQGLTVSGSTLSGNSATGGLFGGIPVPGAGGAIYGFGALTVASSTFTDNSAYEGGAIDFPGGAVTVRDSVFNGNSATDGGGIYFASGTLDVRGSTFSGNTASDSGGAIYNLGAATVQASTLSGNIAGSAGGGLFNAASGTLAVKDSTVLNNVAPLGADLYNLGAATLNDSTVGVIGP